jgi:predicted TIM-barrel fold metal-dependent hydrolase
MLLISEVGFYGYRALSHFILSGVFERFPRLKVVLTEGSAAALPRTIADLDQVIRNVQKGAIGELKYRAEDAVPKLASEYFAQNCWIGSSFPRPSDVEVAKMVGPDRWMWGSDYPHDEGTPPFTREHLRQVFPGWDVPELRRVLGENAAKLYGFDMAALAPYASQYGPTVEEIGTPLTELPADANAALLNSARELAPV